VDAKGPSKTETFRVKKLRLPERRNLSVAKQKGEVDKRERRVLLQKRETSKYYILFDALHLSSLEGKVVAK